MKSKKQPVLGWGSIACLAQAAWAVGEQLEGQPSLSQQPKSLLASRPPAHPQANKNECFVILLGTYFWEYCGGTSKGYN